MNPERLANLLFVVLVATGCGGLPCPNLPEGCVAVGRTGLQCGVITCGLDASVRDGGVNDGSSTDANLDATVDAAGDAALDATPMDTDVLDGAQIDASDATDGAQGDASQSDASQSDATFDPTGCNATEGIECDGDWTGINPVTGRNFCEFTCGSSSCCSPQRGSFVCAPRDAHGQCPRADLFVEADAAAASVRITEQNFAADSCELVEGCVVTPGLRRLLRFTTNTPNIGGADMFLGQVPPDGQSTERFEWSACHGHHHFDSYAAYSLRNDSGAEVAQGHKQAFCLLDFQRSNSTDPFINPEARYGCGFQGIQRGWQDNYGAGLPCQWVDITDVPAGTYNLEVRINTQHILAESSYDNNTMRIPVTIPARGGSADASVSDARLDAPDGGSASITRPCVTTTGVNRECGWVANATDLTCTPGATWLVGCTSCAESLGSCSGEPVMRLCAGARECSYTEALATGGRCADSCPVEYVTCPASGVIRPFHGAMRSGDSYTCNIVGRSAF